jgi:FkbM family methyltransferase
MAGRALRRRKPDFSRERPIVSILGDDVSDTVRAEGVYERAILEFLRDCVIDPHKAAAQVAVDVGANIGNHALFLSDIFDRIIAFEPNPLTRSILAINIEMNQVRNIDVNGVGLSNAPGKAILRFDRLNIGAATLGVYPNPHQNRDQSCEIELAVGDDVIDRALPIGFIKIDVEGVEEDALKGLEKTLRAQMPIVMIEQWEDVIDPTSGTSPSASFLRTLGYEQWELAPSALSRGKIGKLSSLLLGRADYIMRMVDHLQKREYPALIFTPPGYEFPSHK